MRSILPRGIAEAVSPSPAWRSWHLRRGVPVHFVERAELEEIAQGKTHGGVVATAGERQFQPLEELLAQPGNCFLVMIDGVEDPYNFGSAIRSLYAAGATGLVLPPRNWMSAAGTVARSSAGASELIPTAISSSTALAIETCSSRGLTVFVADKQGQVGLYAADLTQPLLLVIGGEHRGINRKLSDEKLTRISIPYGRSDAKALGTAATAAIVGFEALRQRSYL